MSPRRAEVAGSLAAALWALFCLRWFDAAAPFRPSWLGGVHPAVLAVPCFFLAHLWAHLRWSDIRGPALQGPRGGLLLLVAVTVLFRLPLVWQGAAGYVTPDGALSGIVSLHVRDGIDHLVFVPHVPYSGSLKSHLSAPLAEIGRAHV